MDQKTWDRLTPAQREAQRDNSNLNLQLLPYVGRKIRVTPSRPFGASTFKVGRSTGWRPVLLAVQGNQPGSSDTIGVDERFDRVDVIQ